MVSLFFPGLFALMGCLFLVIAWRSGKNTVFILKSGSQTQGIVIENAPRKLRTGEQFKTTSRAPVVQFRTNFGKIITYYSTDYTTPAMYEVGQTVDIWYLPNDPQRATLKGKEIWILPVVFGAFGLALTLIGLMWMIRILFKL